VSLGHPDDERPTLTLANRSDVDFNRQVTAPSSTGSIID
jgi:hypothetical protein